MEKWQRDYIKRNLPELVDLTLCNTKLLTLLYAKDILSDEEFHEIDNAQNPKRKASKLYEILVTRKNAYKFFLIACKDTKQTGVVSILEDGERDNKSEQLNNITQGTITEKSSVKSNFVKTPLPETSTVTVKFQKPNLTDIPNDSLDPLNSKAIPSSSKSYVDNIPPPEDRNKQNSNVKGTFQFFQDLSKNPQQNITKSFGVLKINPPSSNDITLSDSKDTQNRPPKDSDKEVEKIKKQPRLYSDLSDKRTNYLPSIVSTASEVNINETDNEGRSSLHRALADGQSLAVIKNLIDNKADYKLKDNLKEGVLHFAVRGGNKEVIRFLLSLKLDINEMDELGETPLHKVRSTKNRNYFEMTNILLSNGANFKVKDKKGNTAAHYLADTEHISCSDFQIWAEGMINSGQGHIFFIRGRYGRTPIQSAIMRLDLDLTTFKLILDYSKVDVDQPDDQGSTLLHLALNFGRSLETIINLVSLGANIKIKNKRGLGVLHFAVVGGNKEVIQYLISRGLDVNEKNDNGNTPLQVVRETKPKRYVELTKLLLDNGAVLYSKNYAGNTLAHAMAILKDVSCENFKIWVTAMIENGHAHLFTIRGQFGRIPLHSAMQTRDLDLETIKLIIESAKLDINQPDEQGNTILHLALGCGRSLNTIKNLVELGADWKRKGMEDCSVLHSAVRASNKEAFLFFKSLGADVNATDRYERTPLHHVAWTRHKDYLGMTRFLLENGANLNAKDIYGKTVANCMCSGFCVILEDYGVWKEGMIQLGHAAFFKQ